MDGAANKPEVIHVEKVWTEFGDMVVHRDLDLSIEQHEIVALVGGSGSGKTTLVRHMLGLSRPTRGNVRVLGEDINPPEEEKARPELALLRNRWGMLFQHGALFSALNVFNNIAQPMRELRTLPEHLIRDSVLLKLDMVGLTPKDALKMPSELSGGMVKRVALARALALEPELLFLDEPTAGLDPSLSDSFVDLIRTLHAQMKLTVLMVTHDLDTIFSLATKVAVLADKRVVAFGPPGEVIKVEHPFIAEFFRGPRGQRARKALSENPEAYDAGGGPGRH